MADDLNWLSATQLVKSYKKRKLSPVEVTRACLAQIARHDGAINAMCLVDEKSALKQAKASEARWHKGKPLGAVDGVPALVKDLILVKGWPTLRGSKTIERDQAWNQDGPAVARLREEGAVLLGLTTTPEFGWKGVTDSPLTGITRNPWDVTKTPGGSSGGSSAAVAAGYAPLALGTDGGGSIRIPAGFSGIFGHKPSFGRVPAWPLSPFGTVAHTGPMTRRVADAALMMNVIAKPDARDWHSLPYDGRDYVKQLSKGIKGLRIAFSPALGHAEVDPEVAQAVDKAVKVLRSLGARIDKVDPGFDDPGPIFRVLWWSGARALLGRLPAEKLALLDPGLADVVKQSMQITPEDYFDAVKARGALGTQMRQFMQKYDLLVTPTLPIPAFEAGKLSPADDGTGKWVNWTPFSYPFNLTQQPAASVPCGFTKAGLPIGLHIIGRMFDDDGVLRAAEAYEAATDWHKQRPALKG
ncbi:amidase [Nordella sp. HKS 07]|uniref:amidase n=1 Tax=Nordella sp. HKS 07 TaxID=2712222 RepID=UPI0013E119F1|nr:amidase [Nordella sp. HKS 07]QIG46390.1 amidase [Nordella sp. HKS 07]